MKLFLDRCYVQFLAEWHAEHGSYVGFLEANSKAIGLFLDIDAWKAHEAASTDDPRALKALADFTEASALATTYFQERLSDMALTSAQAFIAAKIEKQAKDHKTITCAFINLLKTQAEEHLHSLGYKDCFIKGLIIN